MSCSGKLSMAKLGSSISSNTFTHSSFFPLPKSCSICSQRSSKAQPAAEPETAKCTTASTAKLPSMKLKPTNHMRRKCTSSDIALDARLASKAEAKDCRRRNEFRKQWQGSKDANDLRKGTDTRTLGYAL